MFKLQTLEQQVARAQAGCEWSMEALLARYEPFARALAGRIFIPGCEYEDACQIARLGLLEALRMWDASRGVPLSRYAWRAARGAVLDARVAERREKRVALNAALSIEELGREAGEGWHPAFAYHDPSDAVRRIPEPLSRAREHLTPLEWEVAVAWCDGCRCTEIARRVGVSPKRADNTWQRVRRKLRRLPVWE